MEADELIKMKLSDKEAPMQDSIDYFVAENDHAKNAQQPIELRVQSNDKPVILVVDDEFMNIEVMSLMLEGKGYTLDGSTRGVEAFEMVKVRFRQAI